MDNGRAMQRRIVKSYSYEEASSIAWEFINMTEQEEDLIYRMQKLVGDRWALIAGRIPGRKPEEIERFWLMKRSEGFANKQREEPKDRSKIISSSVWCWDVFGLLFNQIMLQCDV